MKKDNGCPTCGSKDFGNIQMEKMMMVFLFGKNNAIIVKNSGMLNECYLLVPKILF